VGLTPTLSENGLGVSARTALVNAARGLAKGLFEVLHHFVGGEENSHKR